MDLSWLNVDKLCAEVDLSQDPAIVDLSNVTSFEPFAIVYLGMFLRFHRLQGKSFQVRLPQSAAARAYLSTQNFWERFNFDPQSVADAGLRRLTNSTSLIERVSRVAEDAGDAVLVVLRSVAARLPREAIAELTAELIDNFAQHSERNLAAFMLQYYPTKHRVVLAIGDCGTGIRESLASVERYHHVASQPHWEAALLAFEPQVTRKSEGGTGLTDVRATIIEMGGNLVLATGNGYVHVASGETEYGAMAYDLPGVQIELTSPENR